MNQPLAATTVLHLVDHQTPLDAVGLIGQLAPTSSQRVVALGDGPHVRLLARRHITHQVVPLRGRAEPFRSLPLARWLANSPADARPALLHAHSLRAGSCAAAAAMVWPALRDIPLLVETHREPEDRPLRFLAARTRSRAIWFVPRSAALARVLADAGICQTRIAEPLPPATDTVCHRLAPSAARLQLGLDDDAGPILLAGGWCRRREGQKHAFWAAAIMSMLHDRLKIIIPGDGPQRDMLIDWTARAGFGYLTVFPGDRGDWPTLLAAADIMVFTDGHDERGSFEPDTAPLLWAMRAGVPIVATRSRGVEELLADGVSGLLVEPRHPRLLAMAVRRLLGDRPLCSAIAANARAAADKLPTGNALLAEYSRLYDAKGDFHLLDVT